jgi:hypothetical protein
MDYNLTSMRINWRLAFFCHIKTTMKNDSEQYALFSNILHHHPNVLSLGYVVILIFFVLKKEVDQAQ